MISTSEIKVSVLVDERDADRAVQAIHDRFFKGDAGPVGQPHQGQAGHVLILGHAAHMGFFHSLHDLLHIGARLAAEAGGPQRRRGLQDVRGPVLRRHQHQHDLHQRDQGAVLSLFFIPSFLSQFYSGCILPWEET